MTTQALRNIGDLTPTEFENFTYDLLQSSGVHHLVWRTPGPDGGRDIEGEVFQTDLSGHTDTQRWYIECKRYASSIDWPTVWKKIAYADSNRADFLLLVTNSNPSPQCETEIAKWNAENRSMKVRVWRGYDIEGLLNAYPVLAAKYGLRHIDNSLVRNFLDLGFEISKISQSTDASYEFGTNLLPGLEASAALSELLSQRISDLALYGRFAQTTRRVIDSFYDWFEVDGNRSETNEVAIRATAAVLKYITGADRIRASLNPSSFSLVPAAPRHELNDSGLRLMTLVGVWADLDLHLINAGDGEPTLVYSYR